MTKRIVALLIAVLFVASCSMLTACGGGDTTTAKKPASTPASTPAETSGAATPTPTTPTTPDQGGDDTSTPVEPSTPDDGGDGEAPAEPTKADDPSAWVNWLLEIYARADSDDIFAEKGYTYLYGCSEYNCGYHDDPAYTSSLWELWGERYHMCYQFDMLEFDGTANVNTEDYAYTFEIYYRPLTEEYEPIGDGKFQMITTEPWSIYSWGGESTMVIYRIPTYEAGMRLSLKEDGSFQDYEMVFVIYEKATGNFMGWNRVYTKCTDATLAHQNDAIDAGILQAD